MNRQCFCSVKPCQPVKFWNFSKGHITDYMSLIGLSKDSLPSLTKGERFSNTCSICLLSSSEASSTCRVSSSDSSECSLYHWLPWQGRLQWTNDLLKIYRWKQKSGPCYGSENRLSNAAEKWLFWFVFLHLCSFTYSSFLLVQSSLKKIMPSLLHASITNAVGRNQYGSS